jgi:FxLD family lantipeptide
MPPILEANEVKDVFALDVQILTDGSVGDAGRGCDTNDGCAPTCASSCTSHA